MTGLLVRAKALFDGTRVVPAARVLIDDGVFVDIRSGEDPVHRPDTTVVDLPGATLLPGLIDSHVHATLAGGMAPVSDRDELTSIVTANLRTAARAGITTVRDCGSAGSTMFDLRERSGLARALIAGPALTPPGGHAHTLGLGVSGVEALRDAVHGLAAAGVDLIKVIGSGGGTPGTDPLLPTYDVDELRAVVDAAADHGIPVTVHALNADTVRIGLDAGVRHFEHGWLYRDASERHPELLRRLADTGSTICPTVWAVAHRIPLLRARLEEAPDDGALRAELETVHATTDLVMRSVADCHAAGVRIVAGTDAGWRGVGFGELVDELLLLQRCGLSAREAISAATNPIGSGSVADLAAFRGDPLSDLDDVRRVVATVVRGELVQPDS